MEPDYTPLLKTAKELLGTIQGLNFLWSSRLERSTAPLEETKFSDVAAAIKKILGSPKCVAIFIRDKDAKELILKGAAGYKPGAVFTYDLKRRSMTREVFETLLPRNCKASDLSGPSKLRCGSLMEGGRFVNVVAVPICTSSEPGKAECFGVLKIENDGDDETTPVREEVYSSGFIIAHLLALQCERLWYGDLWKQVTRDKGEDGSAYFSRLTVTLRHLLRAQAAFAYSLSQDGGEIHPQGGSVAMTTHKLTDDSLVSSAVSNPGGCLVLEQSVLDGRSDDAFLEELRNTLSEVKSLLVAPAIDEQRQICGVLVFANSEAGKFADEDEQVARELGKRIATYLKNAEVRSDKSLTGLEELQKRLGPSVRLKDSALRKRVREVQKERTASEGRITGDDCAKYLQVSRPYFLKLVRLLKDEDSKVPSPEKVSSISKASS